MKDYLAIAIKLLGGQTKAAELLGVTQPGVRYWLKEAKDGIPPEYCPDIERALNGKITKEQLRPDVFRGLA